MPYERRRRTMVVFHAHPDDEALITAGAMARAAAEGHRVVLVVATDGGLGTTRDSRVPAGGLGRLRWREQTESAERIGVHRLVPLGYADSGAEPTVPVDPVGRIRFVRTSVEDAAERLAVILRQEAADVLVTDDEGGGYGHRDHVWAHRVGARAAELAGTSRVLQATIPIAYAPVRSITHCVDVRPFVATKRSALRAHASQSSRTVGGDRMLVCWRGLPPLLFGLVFGREWFIGERVGRRRFDREILPPAVE